MTETASTAKTGSRIDRVDVLPLAIPYPTPRRFGKNVITSGENIIVRVHTDDGLTGLGEAISRPYVYGESMASIVHAISQWFAPVTIGQSIFDVDRLWRQWDLVALNYAAKAGLDMAIHDLQAQAAGLPLWRWLGGTDPVVPLSWILTYGSPEAVLAEAQKWSERGFRSFKVKISRSREHDRSVLTALTDGLPAGTRFYADANGTLSRSDFVLRATELAQFGIELLEDPLPTADMTTRHALWASSPVPFLSDETAKNVGEAALEIQAGGVDTFSLKIFRTGIHRSREIATIARAFERQCLAGGQGETQAGSIIGAHFASALGGMGFDRYLAETSSSYRFDFDVVGAGARLRDGAVHLTEQPGSGIVLDDEVVSRLAAGPWWTSYRTSGHWYS
jgi:L-alanine-DL-glutamate epimerase-like enolase superfamily enzyme